MEFKSDWKTYKDLVYAVVEQGLSGRDIQSAITETKTFTIYTRSEILEFDNVSLEDYKSDCLNLYIKEIEYRLTSTENQLSRAVERLGLNEGHTNSFDVAIQNAMIKGENKMELTYKGIVFDDVVTDEDRHQWTGICNPCLARHGILVGEETPDNEGSGICGVSGCINEANRYIDFQQDVDKTPNMDDALKGRIREWAEDNDKVLKDEQVEAMLKGVRYCFDEMINDSISTAYDNITD